MADDVSDKVVWWFSGTGNCLVVARDLAARLGAKLEPMTTALARGGVEAPSVLAVLVFPIYICDMPAAVARFAASLANPGRCRITAVATYGGGVGEAFAELEDILAVRGGRLHARYGLHLPQNAFLKAWENNLALLRRAGKRVARMAPEIAAGKPIQSLDGGWIQPWLWRFRLPIRAASRRSLLERSGQADDPSIKNRDLFGPTDRSYRVADACTACGLCQRLCPVDNIRLEAGRPVWQGRCEACLACYHHCPVRAISGGFVSPGYFYRNPLVTPAELAVQRGGGPA